jgi:hypothetical protein
MHSRQVAINAGITILLTLAAAGAAPTDVTKTHFQNRVAIANFEARAGCVTTQVIAQLDAFEQDPINPPGPATVTEGASIRVTQFSDPANGPACEFFYLQDASADPFDPAYNFHLEVRRLDKHRARLVRSASLFDITAAIYRDTVFAFEWGPVGDAVVISGEESGEFEGEVITVKFVESTQPTVAVGTVRQCESSLDPGVIDGVCTPESLAGKPNLIPNPANDEETKIVDFRAHETRRPSP